MYILQSNCDYPRIHEGSKSTSVLKLENFINLLRKCKIKI